ncbi:TIM barrel protein [Propionimicrobium sp. BV2F7]|uniref:TIM barrel protein n=1 Tax=Propionimicrobium TaxID=203133 RepID=UPI0005684096|nr:TIM barrel protein [Propionimicrobium sp. BV2F7]
MKSPVGIYEKGLPGNLSWQDKCRLAGESGYSFIELSIDESSEKLDRLYLEPSVIRTFEDCARDSNIYIGALTLSANRRFALGATNSLEREQGLSIAKRAIEFASLTHCELVQIAGYLDYYNEASPESLDFFIENLQELLHFSRSLSLDFAIENVDGQDFVNVEQILDVINVINNPRLGIYFDVGNVIGNSLSIASQFAKAVDHVKAIQLKEAKAGVFRGVPFGRGEVPFSDLADLLQLSRYSGPISIEMWNDENDTDLPKNVLAWIKARISCL